MLYAVGSMANKACGITEIGKTNLRSTFIPKTIGFPYTPHKGKHVEYPQNYCYSRSLTQDCYFLSEIVIYKRLYYPPPGS